jgi:hypothetical protein
MSMTVLADEEIKAHERPFRGGGWIDDLEPDDEGFWARTGRKVALRNLVYSILTEHLGFCGPTSSGWARSWARWPGRSAAGWPTASVAPVSL